GARAALRHSRPRGARRRRRRRGRARRGPARPAAAVHGRRRACRGRGRPARPRAAELARAAVDARGRVPPPHRTDPGGLMTLVRTEPAAATAPAVTGGWWSVTEHWLRDYRRVWFGTAVTSFL